MEILGIIAAAKALIGVIGTLAQLGEDVAPLIVIGRNAIEDMKAGTAVSAEEIADLDAKVAGYEADFVDAVAAHKAAVAQAAS